MPRNSRPSLIQKIARQADVTFKSNCGSKVFMTNLTELGALLNRVRVAHLNIKPHQKDSSGSDSQCHRDAPVTYMHICETRGFSIGVFTLRSGASIPLHDHPGMNGMLKVLYGKVRVRCFDKLDEQLDPQTDPGLLADSSLLVTDQKASLHLAAMRSSGEFTEQSAPCVLSPHKDNLHQIDALDGSAAFIDILAPPYDPDHGRDCHYYRILRTNSKSGNNDSDRGEETVWLLEIPQPEEFWCGSEPYPGPKVRV